MLKAMENVRESKLIVYAAAKQHDLPRKTLEDRLKGSVQHGTNPGPCTALTPGSTWVSINTHNDKSCLGHSSFGK